MKLLVLLFILSLTQAWGKWGLTTYNIRNFNPSAGSTDLIELEKIIKIERSEVMGFIEVVNVPDFQKMISRVLPGHRVLTSRCGGFGRQKLALVYDPLIFKFLKQDEDLTFSSSNGVCGSLRPVLLVSLQHLNLGKTFTFGVVHLKAGGGEAALSTRWQQYQKLIKLYKTYQKNALVLLGDFNTTGYINRDTDFLKFEAFLQSSSSRSMSEGLRCSSYWRPDWESPVLESSLLDHVVIPESLVADVQEAKIGAHCARSACQAATAQELGASFEKVSDHCPLKVTFN